MTNWNEQFSGEEFFYGTEPNDFLRERARLLSHGGRVLCLAEGEGRNAVFLAGRGLKVVAVDSSESGLAKLHKLAAQRQVQVETVAADLTAYPIGVEVWDGIVSIFCDVPGEARKALHQRCVAGLKPGGIFLLEAYRPEQLERDTGGPREPDKLPTLEQLKAELAGIEFLHAEELEREIHEGEEHRGSSAVVQIVGRKPM